MKQNTRHFLIWALVVVVVIGLFVYGFVPFTKWLFVDQTLELYKQSANEFSTDDEQKTAYRGTITDTLFYRSTAQNGKTDTVLHRQTIQLEQQETPSDKRPKREDVGTFGDSAGLLNAFFSFMAFMAVIVTMYFQSRRDGQDKQNGARVLFEQEFFAMTGMLENIVSHLRFEDQENAKIKKVTTDVASKLVNKYYKDAEKTLENEMHDEPHPKIVEGREVFKYLYTDRPNFNLVSCVSKDKDIRATTESQEYCFDGTLDHYFRYLYRILKHIDKSELLGRLDEPKKQREYYAHLFRAQLSHYELLMLFYNGLLGENPQTIKKLIERYAMFNNLRAWELGRFQKDYYQAILDEEMCDDPEDIDEQTTYRVTAFWDEKRLKEIKERAKRENNGKLCCKNGADNQQKQQRKKDTERVTPSKPKEKKKESKVKTLEDVVKKKKLGKKKH